MKLFSSALAFFLAAVTAGAAGPTVPALRFDKVPLGNVVRILSARFSAPVTITANARAPITGDFSGLAVGAALTAVARQAGLIARPLGAKASAGFVLEPPPVPPPGPTPAEIALGLQAAARRRAALLQQRTALMQQAPP